MIILDEFCSWFIMISLINSVRLGQTYREFILFLISSRKRSLEVFWRKMTDLWSETVPTLEDAKRFLVNSGGEWQDAVLCPWSVEEPGDCYLCIHESSHSGLGTPFNLRWGLKLKKYSLKLRSAADRGPQSHWTSFGTTTFQFWSMSSRRRPTFSWSSGERASKSLW